MLLWHEGRAIAQVRKNEIMADEAIVFSSELALATAVTSLILKLIGTRLAPTRAKLRQ